MKLIVMAISVALASVSEDKHDFLSNFNEVPTLPPENLGALPKCGDNDQKGKFMCVPYFNCDPNTNTVVEVPEVDGSNLIHPRVQDPKCDHFLQMCCGIPNGTELPNIQVPTINFEFQSQCGIKDKVSWLVEIIDINNNLIICEGSLITPVVVLTEAHCVTGLQPFNIKIRVRNEGDLVEVAKIIIHEHFMNKTLYNDIALLILNSSLTKTDTTGTVCLPESYMSFDSENCLLTEWSKNHSSSLKEVLLSLLRSSECQKTLRTTNLGKDFILDRSFICTGTDVCMGDGGGPLVCADSSNQNRYYQVGIVSWSLECDETPSVYTNVTLFRDWIDVKLAELEYNSAPYTF